MILLEKMVWFGLCSHSLSFWPHVFVFQLLLVCWTYGVIANYHLKALSASSCGRYANQFHLKHFIQLETKWMNSITILCAPV